MLHPKIVDINQKDDFKLSKLTLVKKKHKGYHTFRRMDEIKYLYDGRFEGNVLIVGRTGCRKTTFVQNLAKNKLFRDIKEVHWISEIELSEDREENIRDCFVDQKVNFDYPSNVEDFDYLIEVYKRRKADYVENVFGEKMILNKLIVMNDVSGLADKSDNFANFLTVSCKYEITCVYIFHTIYPNRQKWQMIMSQTQIFNFFPGSVHTGSVVRILSNFANSYKNTYIANRNIWINRLYFDISNSRQKQCLTIDTRDVNKLGPGKFRTQVDKFVIIIGTKLILILILFWQQESKHHKRVK